MSQTVGDFIVARLHAWGVRRMFGYPGGINGVFGALNRSDGAIEFIQARHEEMAAFMASAYAKFSGELGVCIATSGPGATHLVGPSYYWQSNALMEFEPPISGEFGLKSQVKTKSTVTRSLGAARFPGRGSSRLSAGVRQLVEMKYAKQTFG